MVSHLSGVIFPGNRAMVKTDLTEINPDRNWFESISKSCLPLKKKKAKVFKLSQKIKLNRNWQIRHSSMETAYIELLKNRLWTGQYLRVCLIVGPNSRQKVARPCLMGSLKTKNWVPSNGVPALL